MLTSLLHWPSVFLVSTTLSIIVNKYVLSFLKFTYPTIFQSWQMGFIFISVITSWTLNFTKAPVLSRSLALTLLPHAVLFTIGIYSGSIALSRLPVPVICSTFGSASTVSYFLINKKTSKRLLLLGSIQLFGVLICLSQILNLNETTYVWLALNWTVTVAGKVYNDGSKITDSDVSKVFYNTTTSVAILMTISVATGELRKSLLFPQLYFIRFHVGCLLSGACGSVAVIANFKISEQKIKHEVSFLSSCALLSVSLLSLLVYGLSLEIRMLVCCFSSLICGVAFTHFSVSGEQGNHSKQANITGVEVPPGSRSAVAI